jgi:hypothetical protein
MRSGLLTVGIILLVLGAIFYFVPSPATAYNDNTASVDTTKYVEGDAYQTYTGSYGLNNTNTTNDTMTAANDDTTTTSTTTSNAFDQDTTTTSNGDTTTTSDNGVTVIYVFMDCDGSIFPLTSNNVPAGADTSCGTAPDFDTGRTVSETYGDTTNSDTTTTSVGNSTNDTMTVGTNQGTDSTDTTTVSSTGTEAGTGGSDTTGAAITNDGTSDSTSTDSSETSSTDDTTTTASSFGGSTMRTLALIAMILGAILTVLGLILPSADEATDRRARTTGTSGRRVEYERTTERKKE